MPDEVVTTPVETTVVTPPQEEKPKESATTDGGEKVEDKEPKPSEEAPEVNLKGFDIAEDGQIRLTIGNSVYLGKTVDEVWNKHIEGEAEKDKAFKDAQAKLREGKVRSSIREPVGESEEELPPPPEQGQYLRAVFTEKALNPEMASWSKDDPRWDEHQEKESLKDWKMTELRAEINAAKQEAARRYLADETKWLNLHTLRFELTPAVRKLVEDSGLEPDEFGELYLEVIAKSENHYKNGELNPSAILVEMGKKIIGKLRSSGADSQVLKEQKKKLEEELEKKKREIAGGSRTTHSPQNNDKAPKSIGDAFKRAAELFR